VAVVAVTDSGEVTTVYNLRVSEFHTYFVGCQGWGFSVWAHNLGCHMAEALNEIPTVTRRFTQQQLSTVIGRALEGEADVAAATRRLRGFLADNGIHLTAEQEARVFGAALRDTRLAGADLTRHLVRPPAPPPQIPPGVDPAAGWTWDRWNAIPNQGTAQNPIRIILDRNGQPVRIYGKLEGSSTTRGHFEAMRNQAIRLAESGEYAEIHFQHGWGTASGEASATNRLTPDVLGVRRTNVSRPAQVDGWEVWSNTDLSRSVDLNGKLTRGRASLPEGRRGTIEVIDPEP
jgi:hypothetical protein